VFSKLASTKKKGQQKFMIQEIIMSPTMDGIECLVMNHERSWMRPLTNYLEKKKACANDSKEIIWTLEGWEDLDPLMKVWDGRNPWEDSVTIAEARTRMEWVIQMEQDEWNNKNK